MKSIYLILFIALIFSACKKDSGTTTVEGQVIDDSSGEPVPNINVALNAYFPKSYSGGGGTVGSYPTDEHGKFSFTFEAREDMEYELSAYKDGLYGKANVPMTPKIYKGRKNKNCIVKVWPCVFILFHTKDVDSIPGHDISTYNYYSVSTKNAEKTALIVLLWEKPLNFRWFTYPTRAGLRHDTAFSVQPLDTIPITVYY